METETIEQMIFKVNTIKCLLFTNQIFDVKVYNFIKVLGGLISGYFVINNGF